MLGRARYSLAWVVPAGDDPAAAAAAGAGAAAVAGGAVASPAAACEGGATLGFGIALAIGGMPPPPPAIMAARAGSETRFMAVLASNTPTNTHSNGPVTALMSGN